MRITQISSPLPGEHLAGTSPVMRPETDNAGWRLRLNFWSGRALTAEALELEQENRAARLAWRGRIPTHGIVTGLEVGIEAPATLPTTLAKAGYFIHVMPGHGFMPDGEDIVIPRPLRVPLDQVPVHYVRIGGPDRGVPAEPPPAGATAGPPRDAGGFLFNVDTFGADHIPWAAALVLCPAEFRAFGGVDPNDPCELDLSRDAFADERRVDASILRLIQLPVAWETFPQLGDRDDPRFRNRLAHVVFTEEAAVSARQQIRFLEAQPAGRRWDAVLRAGAFFPWDLLGVPLALLSSEQAPGSTAASFFLDRASVVRPGGRARHRTRPALRLATAANDAALNPPGAGTPIHWRARVDQFAEHLGLFDLRNATDIAAAASRFQFIPSAGFLPRPVLNFLTTAQALALLPRPNQPPDRAGISHFFPSSFAVEAVPVPIEDLDAALASSAALVPYDLTASSEAVRLLVPLPQRLFDPRLLVVEQEDPIFAETVARFVATRQDWRQRRDFVRTRRDTMQALMGGPQSVIPVPSPEPGQLEPEPVESLAGLGFTQALLSPVATPGPWEVSVDFTTARPVSSPSATLFLRLRVDEDSMPGRIEARWRRGSEEFRFEWTETPSAADEPLDANGRPAATPLWRLYTVTAAELGITTGDITGFALRIEDGRIGIARAGQLLPGEGPRSPFEESWWSAGDDEPAPQFAGGDWTAVGNDSLLAPFEELYTPVFPDGRTEAQRIAEVETALNPPNATPRRVPMSVATDGLERVLAELDAEASEADDFVDASFTRAQVNLYRIRKLILGETAAQKLLINPAIALIAEQETATASAEKLGSFITQAKGKPVAFGTVNDVLSARPAVGSISPSFGPQGGTINAVITGTNLRGASEVTFSGTGVEASIGRVTDTSVQIRITIGGNAAIGPRTVTLRAGDTASTPFSSFTVNPRATTGAMVGLTGPMEFSFHLLNPFIDATREIRTSKVAFDKSSIFTDLKAEALKNVVGERPETGPALPPRGLSIGQRFTEPPATQNLSYARAALTELLNQLPRLRMPLANETVRSLSGQDVSLLALQGRATPPASDPDATPESLRNDAIARLLTTIPLTEDTDEAEVTLAALDFTEVKSAIIRTIERIIQGRRTIITTGLETFSLLGVQRDAAASRVVVIEGRLAEARHDVSVARALRQEEQQRVAAINERRDTLIRDEVKFLAYVRPRTVNLIRQNVPSWRMEPFGVPAPVPACLQRHDEPPPPLNGYIQLFNHAPARWFVTLESLLAKLDTPDKVIALLDSARVSAVSFAVQDTMSVLRASAQAVQLTVLGAQQVIGTLRQKSTLIQVADKRTHRWKDFQREAEQHAAVGDLITGKHGSREVSSAAARELEQIGQVATCLHAEFAAIPPAIRLVWIERFSQFDRPALLRDFTALPEYARLDRSTRRRLQEFADWLFGRVKSAERDAVNLINDLVRLCLLLASHAPVNRIIAGHVPRPTPVRPGIQIPIRPLNPELVRVGMEFHVWNASRVVAKGRVEDLQEGQVSARVDQVEAQITTIDTTMRVQFVPQALSFKL
jgi:hypothetical protein